MPKESLRKRANNLKNEVYALFLCYRDPRVPWYAKVLMLLIIGYAVSPIDLIPDFIPVLGQLDDLLILPVGIALVLKMIPKSVMEEYRKKARDEPISIRAKWVVAAIIVSIYVVAFYVVLKLFFFK